MKCKTNYQISCMLCSVVSVRIGTWELKQSSRLSFFSDGIEQNNYLYCIVLCTI